MRILVLTSIILASSLFPAFAQQEGSAPASTPPTDHKSGTSGSPADQKSESHPAQTDRNSQQVQNPAVGREQSRADDREVGRDWRMHRPDEDNMSRNDREPGRDWKMRDRETNRDRDMKSRSFREREDRDDNRADRNRNNRDYYFEYDDEPRRRVKICFEYANGDEFCRYKR